VAEEGGEGVLPPEAGSELERGIIGCGWVGWCANSTAAASAAAAHAAAGSSYCARLGSELCRTCQAEYMS
jgi:hypothetical protein